MSKEVWCLTLHESSVCAVVIVEVSAVGVLQTVVAQVLSVAKTLKDGVHKALGRDGETEVSMADLRLWLKA